VAESRERELSLTFGALSDPTRRRILSIVLRNPGVSISEVGRQVTVKGPGLSKHLNVLAEAGLIERAKSGRVTSIYLRPTALQQAMHWLSMYEEFWTGSLAKLKNVLEGDS
jgi:DNA-binding transcriptional ArsR family regulator